MILGKAVLLKNFLNLYGEPQRSAWTCTIIHVEFAFILDIIRWQK